MQVINKINTELTMKRTFARNYDSKVKKTNAKAAENSADLYIFLLITQSVWSMVENCFCCNSAICEGPHASYLVTENFNEHIVQKSICIRLQFIIFMMAYVSQMAVMLLGIHKNSSF